MTVGQTWVLVALSFLSLIGFGFSGLLVSQAQARRQKGTQRIRDLVTPYRKIRAASTQIFRPAVKNNKSLVELVASMFGFNPGNQDQYPVKWWIVLGVTLAV
jgi:tight adherence protein B